MGLRQGEGTMLAIPLAVVLLDAAGTVRAGHLRQRRKLAGLTIEEAARRGGLSVSTWNNLENPEHVGFRPKTLRQALRALDVSPDHLVAPVPEEELGDELDKAMASALLGESPKDPHAHGPQLQELLPKLAQLSDRDLEVVTDLVDRLLE